MAIKIWFKGPDANRQCCGCNGKSGPCSSCCTGLNYEVVTNRWTDNPGLLVAPPGGCIIAQDAVDSYVPGTSTAVVTIKNTAGQAFTPNGGTYRQNGISVSLKSGDVLTVSMNTSATTDPAMLANFLSPGGTTNQYQFLAFYYSGNQVDIQNKKTDESYTYAKLLSQDFTDSPLPTGLAFQLYLVGSTSQPLNASGPYLNVSSNVYPNPFVSNFSYLGTTPPLSLIQTGAADVPTISNYFSQSTPSNPFSEISVANVEEQSADFVQRCFTCSGVFPTWQLTSGEGNFGDFQAECDLWNQTVSDYITNEQGLTEGNRGLGFNVFEYSNDTHSSTGDFFAGPSYNSIACNAGNVGQTICYNGYWALDYWYTTSWPTLALSGPFVTPNSFSIQALLDVCLDILPGYGGQFPSNVFNNTTNTQNVTGNSYITDTITVTNSTHPLTVTPIYFYKTNLNSSAACPFSLP